MIDDTIGKIESKIKDSENINQDRKDDLLGLLGTLKTEVDDLSKTNSEQAKSITGFTEISTHEAIREDKDQDLLDISINGLGSTVNGFEATHPKLTEIVNRICVMLSNIGI